MPKGTLLVIDDEASIRNVIHRLFKQRDIEDIGAGTGEAGLELLRENPIDVILTDLRLPGINGIEVLKSARRMDPELEVIIMTAYASIDNAVEAIKLGAFDYITKPFETLEKVIKTVEMAIERRQLKRRNKELERELHRRYGIDNMVCSSKKMLEVLRMVESVAGVDSTVLIEGESGTGKELIAKTIHFKSKRKNGPFIPVDCASLPKELIENELFGHEKGSFTGAHVSTKGLFRMAEGGTIFLDEIGELPLGVQSKLLRVLEERQVRPVGSTEPHPVSVRVIAATNVNLERAVAQNIFRKDLYYRLNVVNIRLPPLRERPEDIPLFVNFFIKEMNSEASEKIKDITSEAMDALINYSWPGNVRELRNVIERCSVLCRSRTITVQDLPQGIVRMSDTTSKSDSLSDLPLSIAAYEKACIERALRKSGENVKEAAKLLNLSRASLYRKMRAYSIKISD